MASITPSSSSVSLTISEDSSILEPLEKKRSHGEAFGHVIEEVFEKPSKLSGAKIAFHKENNQLDQDLLNIGDSFSKMSLTSDDETFSPDTTRELLSSLDSVTSSELTSLSGLPNENDVSTEASGKSIAIRDSLPEQALRLFLNHTKLEPSSIVNDLTKIEKHGKERLTLYSNERTEKLLKLWKRTKEEQRFRIIQDPLELIELHQLDACHTLTSMTKSLKETGIAIMREMREEADPKELLYSVGYVGNDFPADYDFLKKASSFVAKAEREFSQIEEVPQRYLEAKSITTQEKNRYQSSVLEAISSHKEAIFSLEEAIEALSEDNLERSDIYEAKAASSSQAAKGYLDLVECLKKQEQLLKKAEQLVVGRRNTLPNVRHEIGPLLAKAKKAAHSAIDCCERGAHSMEISKISSYQQTGLLFTKALHYFLSCAELMVHEKESALSEKYAKTVITAAIYHRIALVMSEKPEQSGDLLYFVPDIAASYEAAAELYEKSLNLIPALEQASQNKDVFLATELRGKMQGYQEQAALKESHARNILESIYEQLQTFVQLHGL